MMTEEQYKRLEKLRIKKTLGKGEQAELEHLERVLEKYGYEEPTKTEKVVE